MATFFLGQSIGRQTFFGSIDRYNEDNTFQLKFLQYISVKICILAQYISVTIFILASYISVKIFILAGSIDRF